MWEMSAPPHLQTRCRQLCGRVVSGCSRLDLVATTVVPSQSGMKSWRRQVVVQFVCTASVFFFCLEGNVALRGVLRACC